MDSIGLHLKNCAKLSQSCALRAGVPGIASKPTNHCCPALIEEAYEVAGAVRANDTANFREELGDLLLLIVMHAEIASESGRFDINNVLELT